MIEKVQHYNLVRGNKVAGISVFSDKEKMQISLTVVCKNKSELSIVLAEKDVNNFEAIPSLIGKNTPIILIIDGKGVFHKKAEQTSNTNYLSTILPNALPDDFFVQVSQIDEKEVFVSIIRKDLLYPIVQRFLDLGLYVTDVKLGLFEINNIVGFINATDDVINIWGNKLKINTVICEIEKVNDLISTNYSIGNQSIDSFCLPSYAAGVGYFLNKTSIEDLPDIALTSNTEFLWHRLFIIAGWSALIGLFSILLINYLLFDYYNEKYQQSSIQSAVANSMATEYDSLRNILLQRKDFALKTGLTQQTKYTFYIDQFCKNKPEDISLTYFAISPLENKLKENEPVKYLQNNIKIKGYAQSSSSVNEWIKDIKKLNSIEDVYMQNYLQQVDNNNADFELQVKIHENTIE